MGRTGKQNPRLAEDWLFWADEESIIKIIKKKQARNHQHQQLLEEDKILKEKIFGRI